MCAQNSFIIVTFFSFFFFYLLFPLISNCASFRGVRIDEVDVVDEEWVGKREMLTIMVIHVNLFLDISYLSSSMLVPPFNKKV